MGISTCRYRWYGKVEVQGPKERGDRLRHTIMHASQVFHRLFQQYSRNRKLSLAAPLITYSFAGERRKKVHLTLAPRFPHLLRQIKESSS